MIKLNEVTKIYPLGKAEPVTAVRGVSLEIKQGEFMIIVGRSGSGKTTLLNLAAGLTRPTSGEVMLEGVDLWEPVGCAAIGAAQPKIRFRVPVFQPAALADRSGECGLTHGFRIGSRPGTPCTSGRQSCCGNVGLADKLCSYPRQLSAGQQQRVVIARALMNHPQVLLADEPTSNLDEKTELEIMDLFHQLHQDLGITVVMVTHTRQFDLVWHARG